jgi:alpha-aminoadipate carrier protein LysW
LFAWPGRAITFPNSCKGRLNLEKEFFMAECPVCGGAVNLGADTVEGELIPCGECGSELEVKGIDPFVLAEAPKEEEDWGE